MGNDSVEGGVIVPWSRDIAAGLKAGAMVEWDELRNVANTRYDTRWYASAYAQVGPRERPRRLRRGDARALSTAGTVERRRHPRGRGDARPLEGNFQWDFEVSRVLGPGRNAWTEVLRFRWKIL